MNSFRMFFACIVPAFVFCISAACAEPDIESCYARLAKDRLVIGNSVVERVFAWNNGELINSFFKDKRSGHTFTFSDQSPQMLIPNLNGKIQKASFSRIVIAATPISPIRLDVEVLAIYPQAEIKRVFSIYPDCPAIAQNYFVRLRNGGKIDFNPHQTVLDALSMTGNHWKYRAIEFIDRTDYNNNLVREAEIIGYRSQPMRGNLLHVTDLISQQGFFLIKEAPCSGVQLHYPGHDFLCGRNSIQAVGAGFAHGDLANDEWIPVYGLVLGVAGQTEAEFLSNLRAYQRQIRTFLPKRDMMIMMNTWGDRNKDANMKEEFIVKQIDACRRYGISHLQLDDGWQRGLSRNSARQQGQLWNQWRPEDWIPDPEKFPSGFQSIVDYASKNEVVLALWYNPSSDNEYRKWRQDADILVNLHRKYGIRYFKIDGVKLPTKKAEMNFRRFLEHCVTATDYAVFFNLDATDDYRSGFHYLTQYGNIFLENRYTDSAVYYPFWTLRNLWMLSRYVPVQKLQIEFLNKWRNQVQYEHDDPFAPFGIGWDYQFALTMMAQPLAWLEASALPAEALTTAPLIKAYAEIQGDIHAGDIFPIGHEPDGRSWTGFQSVHNGRGYILVLREYNDQENTWVRTCLPAGVSVRFQPLLGSGKSFQTTVREDASVKFELPMAHSFALYSYSIMK